jgi:putative peptidoglycan lipid II flippase
VTDAPDGAPNSLTRSVAGMGAAAAISRAFGGLRMVVIAAVLGTTYLGNAFQSSNSFSNVLFELLAAGALSAVLVPTFVDLLAKGEGRRMEEVAGGVLSLALVGLGAVSVVGVVLAPQIARLLTSGVSDPAVAADQRALAAYLLRFFIPQVLFYALGAVAIGLLHARSKFALTAIAPIGNTVVLVASMVVFHVMVGSHPGLDLSQAERLTLAAGGTLGVVAFVGIPTVGLHLDGFRWRLGVRRAVRDDDVRRLLRLSGWAVLQHSGIGILLIAALIVSGGVAGGVVAYQLAMVVFLAPYGILAQPIHTAVLPRLASDHAAGDTAGMHQALRWAVDALVVATLPVATLLVVLAQPTMRVLAFGEAGRGDGPALLGASLAGLAIGIPVYGGFLLLTRAAYAMGDSRTPALAALGSSLVGAAGMAVVGAMTDGPHLLAGLGLAHSAAYLLGMLWLGNRLRPSVGSLVGVGQLRPVLLAGGVAAVAWLAMRAWSPDGRIVTVVALTVVVGAGLGVYVAGLRVLGALPGRAPSGFRPAEASA